MAVNIVLEKKAQQWYEAAVYIAGKIPNYSEEEQDSFTELFLLINEDIVKQMMLTEKCKLLSIFANQISVKDSELSIYVNQFVGICESIYSKPDKFVEFKSILKAKGWLKEVERFKSQEKNWQQEEIWREEQRRRQYEREAKQRREEEQKKRKKQETKKYEYDINPTPNPYQYEKKKKKSKSKSWLWVLLFLGILWAGYEFLFKDYMRDMNAPRTYVYATNLFLRSSKDADSESNRIGKIPYGAEVVTYSNQNDWAEVKFDGETGYVSSDYLLSYDDFRLLDGVWGNEEAKEVVMTSKCRRAILDFLKYSNWKSGADAWQIYTKAKEVQPNSVLYPSLNDGYSDFSEFAFILTNNQTKKRKLVLYAFGKDESPILRHMEDAPDKGDIKSVSYSKWNNKYRVVYSGQSVANNAPQTDVKPKTEVKSNSKELLIESVSFANVDYNNKVIDSFGSQLYQDMQYLQPSVSFKRETAASEKLKLQVKIWAPNGSMLRGSSSPGKCTFEQEVTLKGENGHFLMSGWGSKEGKIYTKGTYTYEIWHNGKKIFSTSLSIQNRLQTTSDKPVATTDYDNVIFERAEQMPLFPGGSNAMMKYLQKNLRYPATASENGIEGRVTVSFVIEKDGSISNATVVKGVSSSLDREALRVVLAMPKWKPAMIGDRKVRFKYTIPVNFKLNQ